MGTRADFYVGRGKNAEWLGSIAWDGYPDGVPEPLLKKRTEKTYRAAVEAILSTDESATRPKDGWPWPWDDSHTTDYAYAFDGGRVWGCPFGHYWREALNVIVATATTYPVRMNFPFAASVVECSRLLAIARAALTTKEIP
jgi:hypothetical protein